MSTKEFQTIQLNREFIYLHWRGETCHKFKCVCTCMYKRALAFFSQIYKEFYFTRPIFFCFIVNNLHILTIRTSALSSTMATSSKIIWSELWAITLEHMRSTNVAPFSPVYSMIFLWIHVLVHHSVNRPIQEISKELGFGCRDFLHETLNCLCFSSVFTVPLAAFHHPHSNPGESVSFFMVYHHCFILRFAKNTVYRKFLSLHRMRLTRTIGSTTFKT